LGVFDYILRVSLAKANKLAAIVKQEAIVASGVRHLYYAELFEALASSM
jgi:hypothetical protein